MKKLILLFLLMPLFSLGQNHTNVKETKFAVGLCFSPEYFNTVYNTVEGFLENNDYDTNNVSSFGFSAGISVLYKLNDKFTIESGLSYYQTGWEGREAIKLIYIPLDPGDPIYPNTTSYYKYKFISLPLKMNYFFINGKLKLFASAGFVVNYLSETNVHAYDLYKYDIILERNNKVSNEYFNNFNFQIIAGLGADYDLNKHFKLRIEPYFRRSVNSVNNSMIKNYMYSVGANMGVYYKF
jgi:hypothetical protein